MTHLISTGLQNKKDILFGNMEEIYHFHNRLGLCLGHWRPRLLELCWRRAFPPIKGDKQTGSRLGWDKPRADTERQGVTKGPRARRAKPVLVRDGHRAHSFLPIPPSWECQWPLRGFGETWAVLLGPLTLSSLRGSWEDEQRMQRESDGGRSLWS